MKLDIKNFHKIETDEKTTTLQHPSGHTIKIAHKGLSPDHRKELDDLPMKMAKGGYAKFSQKYDPNIKKENSPPSKPSNTMPGSPTMAKAAYTEPNDMGTKIPRQQLMSELNDKHMPDVVLAAMNKEAPPFGPLSSDPKQHYPPCINPSCKSFGKSHPNCRCYGGKFHAKGGEVEKEYFCSSDNPHKSGCEYFKEGGVAENDPAGGVAPEEESLPNPSPTPPPQDSLGAPTPTPLPDPQQISPNPEMSPVQTEQPPQQDQGPQQNNQEPTQEDPMQKFQQHKAAADNELFPEAQAFKADLDNGHIKPETYHDLFAKKETLGKVGTMFGLLLSGMGSGLSHQPNILLEMMNKEITNDLDAQKQSSLNKQNFLKINQQNILNRAQAKNLDAESNSKAYALAKAQMNYAALHKLVSDTNKIPDGPQKDQAMKVLAMMNQGVQNENFNILDRAAAGAAFYKTLFGNQSPETPQGEQQFQNKVSGMKALGPEGQKRAEDMEEKHYPGIPGLASMPLNTADRDQIHSGIAFDRALNKFRDWAKNHSGDLNPVDKNYGQSLAADLQGAYRLATHGGVYKEGEQNFISTVIDSTPTKFFNSIRVLPKLDAASDANRSRLDQILKDKGFQGYPGEQSPREHGEQTKTVNGITYKRGPKGEAIRVK